MVRVVPESTALLLLMLEGLGVVVQEWHTWPNRNISGYARHFILDQNVPPDAEMSTDLAAQRAFIP